MGIEHFPRFQTKFAKKWVDAGPWYAANVFQRAGLFLKEKNSEHKNSCKKENGVVR